MIVKTTGHVLSLRPLAGGRERRIYSYIIHNLSPPSWDLPNLEQPDGVNCPQKDTSTHLANLLQYRDSKFSATYSVSKMFWHLIYWHWWYCILYTFKGKISRFVYPFFSIRITESWCSWGLSIQWSQNKLGKKTENHCIILYTLIDRKWLVAGISIYSTTRVSSWYFTKIGKAWTNSFSIMNQSAQSLGIPTFLHFMFNSICRWRKNNHKNIIKK